MKNQPSGFLSMSIGLVLIFIGVSIAEYNVFNHSPVNPPFQQASVNSSQNEVKGWKTYTDSQYGFSIQYPADFTISEDPGQSVSLVAPVRNYFKTKLANEEKVVILNPTKNCPPLPDEIKGTSTLSTAAGVIEGEGWEGAGAGNIYQGVDYHVLHNELCYTIRLYTHRASDASLFPEYNTPEKIAATNGQDTADRLHFADLTAEMIMTFRFTK
jgi:hypothetical protein